MSEGSTGLGQSAVQGQPGQAHRDNWLAPLGGGGSLTPTFWPLGLCKEYRARMNQEPRTVGCYPTPPTPFTYWTGRSNAISWASWTSPLFTGSASGWNTCGRRCATPAGLSPPSARLATPVASASGWRRTPSDKRQAAGCALPIWTIGARWEGGFQPSRQRVRLPSPAVPPTGLQRAEFPN